MGLQALVPLNTPLTCLGNQETPSVCRSPASSQAPPWLPLPSAGCGLGLGHARRVSRRAGLHAEDHRHPARTPQGRLLLPRAGVPARPQHRLHRSFPPDPVIPPPHSFRSGRARPPPTPRTRHGRALLCPCRGHLVFLSQPPSPDLTPHTPSLRVACWAEHPASRQPLKRS